MWNEHLSNKKTLNSYSLENNINHILGPHMKA